MKHKIFENKTAALHLIPVAKTKLIIVAGHRVCLAHTPQGLVAVEDSCPHLGESLSKGTLNYLNEVVCPWHNYRFNLSTGTECKYRSRNLKTYLLTEETDGLFITLD